MLLEEKIMNDYKQAMKDKDALKASALSFLRSQLKYAMIDKKLDKLPDGDVIAVIKKQVKQRLDSIEQFEKGNRADLAQKEKAEAEILKNYLPREMSREELKGLMEKTVQETGAKSIKDMGAVMKVLLERLAGRCDNKLVSDLVRERLNKT